MFALYVCTGKHDYLIPIRLSRKVKYYFPICFEMEMEADDGSIGEASFPTPSAVLVRELMHLYADDEKVVVVKTLCSDCQIAFDQQEVERLIQESQRG
jgi:hypothetical protein